MHFLSLTSLTTTILGLASLVASSPLAQVKPVPRTYGDCQTGPGICIVYTLSAYQETVKCLKTNLDPAATPGFKGCHARIQYCLLSACGFKAQLCPVLSTWTEAQLDECVAKVSADPSLTDAVAKCVVGSVGNCPLYQWE